MKIGIFWYWNNQVIGVAHNFSFGEADSIGLIDSPYTHVDYWNILRKKHFELQNYEYEKIPRSRVIFDTNKGKTIIYLDKSLLYKAKMQKIYDFFDTNIENSILKKDPHYRI